MIRFDEAFPTAFNNPTNTKQSWGAGAYWWGVNGGGNSKEEEQHKIIAPNMVDEKLRVRLKSRRLSGAFLSCKNWLIPFVKFLMKSLYT